MKILLVDTSVDGHHITYINGLTAVENAEFVALLPETDKKIHCRQIVVNNKEGAKRNFFDFKKWINEVYEVCKEENPDVVHFLYGDSFYRYFGFGLRKFRKYKSIITLHWARSGFLQRISTCRICKNVSTTVVHSAYIKELMESYGAKNIEHVEYPQFNQHFVDKAAACKFWSLDETIPVIGCIGGTRHDKGLDILLEALNYVDKPFQLLIAGKEETFGESFIKERSKKYRDRVHTHLKFLSEEELANAIAACDIIALPYRRVFDGASGPLDEGVSMGKCIVGPNHGTLGYTINRYDLGYTFETENTTSMSEVISRALERNDLTLTEAYLLYQTMLNPKNFSNQYAYLYVQSSFTKGKVAII